MNRLSATVRDMSYDLTSRIARRFVAEQLTKDWLMAVRRGWVTLMTPTIQDYGDVFKALQKIAAFARNLKEQVLNVRRGPKITLKEGPESSKFEKTFMKLMEAIAEAMSRARHWRDCYMGANAHLMGNCQADGEKMLQLFQTKFEEACSWYKRSGGRDRSATFTEFFDDLLKLLYAEAKALKTNYDGEEATHRERGGDEPFNYSSPELHDAAFKEFDFGGMQVIVSDPKFNGRRIIAYVELIEKAFKDIKRKGFGACWYGILVLASDSYEKLSEADQKAYAQAGYKAMEARAGTYHSGFDVIKITAPPNANLVRTLVHELGHRYWFKFMSGGQRARFESLIAGDWSMLHALLLNGHLIPDDELRTFTGLFEKVERGEDLSTAEKALVKERVKEFGLRAGVPLISEYSASRPTEAFAEVFERYVSEMDMTRDQLESFRSVLSAYLPWTYFRGENHT